jgi:sugar phosphate isomerase/epimerase
LTKNRREFLVHSGAIASGAFFLGHGDLFAAGSGRPAWPGPIGLQLYTVRQAMKTDPAGTLKRVAEAGYKEVETGGGTTSASDLKNDVENARLTAVSTHWSYEEAKDRERWAKAIDYVHTLGAHYMVVSFSMAKTAAEWHEIADTFNRAGKECKAADLQFAYHNHLQEFIPIGDSNGYTIITSSTDPKLVQLEMDIFWITWAKQDPLVWFRKYPGRFSLLHIKDRKKDITWDPRKFPAHGQQPFAPVGQGAIDWKRIFLHVKEAGAKHVFVEQDETDGSPFVAIRQSYEYLHGLRI